MKFIIFLLVVGSCLLAARANNITSSTEHEFLKTDVANVKHSIRNWSRLNTVLRSVLSIIKGVTCTVRSVLEINAAILNFFDAIQDCYVDTASSVIKLIQICKDIISICININDTNKNTCNNYDNALENDSKTPPICYKKMYKQNVDLKDELQNAIGFIEATDTYEDCFTNAIEELKEAFAEFPNKIMMCYN